MITYSIEVFEPGAKKPCCEMRDVEAEQKPQIGEVRDVLFKLGTKAGHKQSARVSIRITEVRVGIMHSRLRGDGPTGHGKLHETNWIAVKAVFCAKDYKRGMERLKEFAKKPTGP